MSLSQISWDAMTGRSTPRSRTVTHFGPGEPVAAARHLAWGETRTFFWAPKKGGV